MNFDDFVNELGDWLSFRGLATPGARCVIGASGGPDSTLLLYALRALSQRHDWQWALHVAHLHHGLRGADADADAEFVGRVADQLGLPFHQESADIRSHVAAHGGSTEEVAREHRYDFLERVALRIGGDLVAVGHHADDNAETVLHRICRGTGLRGLAGMADVRPIQPGSRVRLIRPFIQQRRERIEQLCEAKGLEFRIDQTNYSMEFTRGRLRHVVLPQLRENVNPNVSEALLRLAEQARWLGAYLEDAAARVFDSLIVEEQPGYLALNTAALHGKQRIIQAEVVRRAVSLVLRRDQDLGFAHVESVLRLTADPASGKQVHIPGPVVVRKRYDKLEFMPLVDADAQPVTPEFTPTAVRCPGRTPLPSLTYELATEIHDVDAQRVRELTRGSSRFEEWVDAERVRLPLAVRARREGDRFTPLGSHGTKSISDFFIDTKIEPEMRGRMGLLCDQEGPIWVMPLRIDERVKLRPTTRRALRLTLTPLSARAGGSA